MFCTPFVSQCCVIQAKMIANTEFSNSNQSPINFAVYIEAEFSIFLQERVFISVRRRSSTCILNYVKISKILIDS